MVRFWGAPGLLVSVPLDDARFVYGLAEEMDAIVFWTGGYHDGWLPLLMPRPRP